MSSREPMWFCHECHSEMRPLMVPDPVCASCRSSFVEKMENPADDPREFGHPDLAEYGPEALPPGIDNFLMSLQGLMDRGMGDGRPQRRSTGSESSSRVTFQVRGGNGQQRSVTIGGPNTLGRPSSPYTTSPGRVPTMSEFTRRGGSDTPDGPTITGPIMAQYLMALLGQRDPFSELLARGMGDNPGQMGDYVFNQEALDQIITQLMENSNAHRPVPATDEVMAKLPKEILEIGSATLEKDCAVCKEQFSLETEDPDEQVVVTLPCQHPFHEPCIMPWLKSSGTCPVCRHALVPQPEHHPTPTSPTTESGPSSHLRSPRTSPDRHAGPQDPAGLFQSLFGNYLGGRGGNSSRDHGTTSRHNRSSSDPTRRNSNHNTDPRHLPGSWNDDLD